MSISVEDQVSIEHYTFKGAYEEIAVTFKQKHKELDKSVVSVKDCASTVSRASDNTATIAATSKNLQQLIASLKNFKKNLDSSYEAESKAFVDLSARLDHMKTAQNQTGNGLGGTYATTSSSRLLVDFLLRNGYYKAAEDVCQFTNISSLTNLNLFKTADEVEESLKRKETKRCLQLCQANRSKLSKIRSTLELNLRIQEYVELVKGGSLESAIAHARQYVVPLSLEMGCPERIGACMALVAFTGQTSLCRYDDLYSENRWNDLIMEFRRDFLRIHDLSIESPLSIVLQLGLSSFKTYCCFSADSKNAECPVCNERFNGLAQCLPRANFPQTKIVCPSSGMPVDDDLNKPVVLPNGQVVGQMALLSPGADSEESVVCPKSGNVYDANDCRKLFIL